MAKKIVVLLSPIRPSVLQFKENVALQPTNSIHTKNYIAHHTKNFADDAVVVTKQVCKYGC
jgi:hypothetical protein